MPRPPPPADALISSGRSDSLAVSTSSDLSTGTPADSISFFAATFDPIASIDAGIRSDPAEPGVDDGASELGVLGEEAVAGMDRVGASLQRRRDDEVDAQVGLRRGGAGQSHGDVGLADVGQCGIGVGVDGDGLDPESAAGPEDPAGDLGPVGDEESLDGHGVIHILKTPKRSVPS